MPNYTQVVKLNNAATVQEIIEAAKKFAGFDFILKNDGLFGKNGSSMADNFSVTDEHGKVLVYAQTYNAFKVSHHAWNEVTDLTYVSDQERHARLFKFASDMEWELEFGKSFQKDWK